MAEFQSSDYKVHWCVTEASWADVDGPQRNWVNTACLGGTHDCATGESGGSWCVAGGVRAFRKPESTKARDLGPMREYIASILSSWLDLPIPRSELHLRRSAPVALLIEVPRALSYAHVMSCGPCEPVRNDALRALDSLAGIIVLDALVGVRNRPVLHGNHLYSLETGTWSSIDYAESFDPRFDQPYQPPFVEAVRRSWQRITSKELLRAASIPESAFRELLAAPPPEYASEDEREEMLTFLVGRQPPLEEIIREWLSAR